MMTRPRTAVVAILTVVIGVGMLVAQLETPPTSNDAGAPARDDGPADALLGLGELPVTLDLPAPGQVAAVHIGERPVFLIHSPAGHVLVVDAVSSHQPAGSLPKVVVYCRDGWTIDAPDEQMASEVTGMLADLWHSSRFALDGVWLGGPAPTGLPRYDVQSFDEDSVTVGHPRAASVRGVDQAEDALGWTDTIDVGAPVTAPCTDRFDQTCDDAEAADPAVVVWHEPLYPERWLYPFAAAGGWDGRRGATAPCAGRSEPA